MNPIAFRIGPIAVHWYGILIVAGILAATYLSTYLARLRGRNPEFVWDALLWCVVLGIVGARLYHVLTVTPSMGVGRWYYFEHPEKIIALWEGGLGIYGAVAGGALGLFIAARRAKEPMLVWTDIITPGLILAQAIGRWGNFVNQELYGRPTDLPWGIYIEPRFRLAGYEMYERFHPTFFYESMWNVAVCLALVYLTWRYRERLITGLTTGIYFISYSLIRFLLEFIRLDSPMLGPLAIAQYVALGVIVVFAGFLVWRVKVHRARQGDADAAPVEQSAEVEVGEPSG
ncbi:MAG: prolipoprotein diacylglyceryl transferase [Anaerolineae bacterium]|nr:prolipoprotein diacylglyceryl transferase [Anaerolineae bacterium]